MKVRVNTTVPANLNSALAEHICNSEAYGPKSKSLWLSESLIYLLLMPVDEVGALDLHIEGIDTEERSVRAEFRLDDTIKAALDSLLIKLTQQNPYIRWDTSMVIRGAIRYRLKHYDVDYKQVFAKWEDAEKET